jgi:hypothetical protein
MGEARSVCITEMYQQRKNHFYRSRAASLQEQENNTENARRGGFFAPNRIHLRVPRRRRPSDDRFVGATVNAHPTIRPVRATRRNFQPVAEITAARA